MRKQIRRVKGATEWMIFIPAAATPAARDNSRGRQDDVGLSSGVHWTAPAWEDGSLLLTAATLQGGITPFG